MTELRKTKELQHQNPQKTMVMDFLFGKRKDHFTNMQWNVQPEVHIFFVLFSTSKSLERVTIHTIARTSDMVILLRNIHQS